jgi:tetratricopeptide (TPR) repeat protein
MAFPRVILGAAVGLVAMLSGAGCVSQAQRTADRAAADYWVGNYAAARDELKPLADKTDEDFVLNNARLGSTAIADYSLDDAEAAFLRAYEVMNSVGVNNGGRTLGAVVVSESMKVWKGEPFDRAMVNFYLGLIYYIRHDYNNARAAFENSLFKLRDYVDEGKKGNAKDDPYRQVETSFALGHLMLAKSWQRLGREDLARANFQRVAELRPDLAPLADFQRNLDSNLLLVIDQGHGPRKVTDFDGAIVGFGPKPWEDGPIPLPQLIVDGRPVNVNDIARPTVDLLALAQDRRWESIDTIRTVKSAVGTGLIAAGGVEGIRGAYGSGSAQRRDLIASAALVGAGLLLKATSQGDTRAWEMLPRAVFVIPLRLDAGIHDIRVQFPGGAAQTWRDVQTSIPGETTLYLRMQHWNEGPYQWPPPGLTSVQPPQQPNP